MNHDSLVRRGRLPWSPQPSATDLDVWQEYEVPLVGTFSVGDSTVLFTAVSDTSALLSVWAYRALSPAEAAEAVTLEFDTPEDLRQCVERYFAGHEAIFALAHDLRVRQWSPLQVEGGLAETATVFLKQVSKAVESRTDSRTRLRAKLAEVSEATSDLVDA